MCTVRPHAGPIDCFWTCLTPHGRVCTGSSGLGCCVCRVCTVILIGTEPQLILHSAFCARIGVAGRPQPVHMRTSVASPRASQPPDKSVCSKGSPISPATTRPRLVRRLQGAVRRSNIWHKHARFGGSGTGRERHFVYYFEGHLPRTQAPRGRPPRQERGRVARHYLRRSIRAEGHQYPALGEQEAVWQVREGGSGATAGQ